MEPLTATRIESSLIGRTAKFIEGSGLNEMRIRIAGANEITNLTYADWEFEIIAAFQYQDGVCVTLNALTHHPGKVVDGVPISVLNIGTPKYLLKVHEGMNWDQASEVMTGLHGFLGGEIHAYSGADLIQVCGPLRLIKYEDMMEALEQAEE